MFYNQIGDGGMTVSVGSYEAPPAPVAVQPSRDVLSLQEPLLRGPEVESVQKALIKAGFKIKADGVYGRGTHNAVTQFQRRKGLNATGNIDEATRSALGV